jgi:hypothetical protein
MNKGIKEEKHYTRRDYPFAALPCRCFRCSFRPFHVTLFLFHVLSRSCGYCSICHLTLFLFLFRFLVSCFNDLASSSH